MSDLLYRKELLRLAADAHGAGRLTGAKVTGHAHNPICGDHVTIDLKVVNGHVEAVAQETKACVLTQASASILGLALKQMSRANVDALYGALVAMLQQGGSAPGVPFGAFAAFKGAMEYPGRHRCVLLPVEAALAAFDASETA
ncbi:MAG TPA: iron-sulfur cluster assembly scaffold protein [Rhizomicrobium sp.]|nr:iron-sulfur cluster assembly scaffold protein [Rhizomicrobium sp.]